MRGSDLGYFTERPFSIVVVRLSCKQKVGGSIPPVGTRTKREFLELSFYSFGSIAPIATPYLYHFVFVLEILFCAEGHLFGLLANARLGIRRHPLLEEVVLALHTDALHEVERVRGTVDFAIAELHG